MHKEPGWKDFKRLWKTHRLEMNKIGMGVGQILAGRCQLSEGVAGSSASSVASSVAGGSGQSAAGKGQRKGGQQKLPCPICQKLFAQMPKHSPYCYQHKQSVEEAAKQAKADGDTTFAQFTQKSLTPSSMEFRKLILDFEASCPARGRGRPRSKYNWAVMLEEWAATSKHAKDDVG